jgi:hypothetical protein
MTLALERHFFLAPNILLDSTHSKKDFEKKSMGENFLFFGKITMKFPILLGKFLLFKKMVRTGGRKKSTPKSSVNQGTEGEVVFVHFAAIDKCAEGPTLDLGEELVACREHESSGRRRRDSDNGEGCSKSS